MPHAELPRPPCMALPRVGPTCAYVSSFALGVGLSRLPGRPGGEPSGHGIIIVFAGTLSTLR
jgi:hypothetical protein